MRIPNLDWLADLFADAVPDPDEPTADDSPEDDDAPQWWRCAAPRPAALDGRAPHAIGR